MDGLNGKGVVLVGASSGIGRAAAQAFARRGARLVLAARRVALLEEVAEECRNLGGEAHVVETDVTDADAVHRLAERAEAALGTIDVWINNAGVGALGRFEDTPVAAHRRVIETNLLGPLHGAHAVLPRLRRQGHGVLITTVSVGAYTPAPYAAAYAAGKFGLEGMLESLRAELVDEPHIHVCGVYPSFTDTPGMKHAANYTGHALEPQSPFYDDPEDVAETMVALALHPKPRATVGALAKLALLGHTTAPRLVEAVAGLGAHRHFRNTPPEADTDGNLFAPVERGRGVRGGFRTPLPGWTAPVAMAGLTVAAAAAYSALAHRR
ncbi:SDR family oxidoreductase [Azospirillum sp. ST 5-10]|uniref:SDR family oxidoreductase n=1 Tax=unclassified Azospirillum TaxID=2630922 RepID=UPI003F4A031C